MGNRRSVFEPDLLNAYQECTYFTEKQIKKLYRRFSSLNPKKISSRTADVDTRLSFNEVQKLNELSENPFKERICEVFSTDGRGMTFEDFLDMCSVFSESAPWELKASYAFRIFDFDSDAYIGPSDIERTLHCITDERFTKEDAAVVIEHVIEEIDIDQDGKLSYLEFEHVISKAPDFTNLFRITI